MRRVVFNNLEVGLFVADRAKCVFTPDSDSSIGVVDEHGIVQGGAIYTGYTGSSCFTHIAGRDERWMTRDMLWAGFDYPFVQLGCAWIYGLVEEANTPALNFDLHIGFKRLYHIPGMFPSGDGVLMGMQRGECRWLRLKPRTLVARGNHDGR